MGMVRSYKVEVWKNTVGRPRGQLVRRFTVSGESRENARQQALDLVDSDGAPKSAGFARLGGGSAPDGIVVSYSVAEPATP